MSEQSPEHDFGQCASELRHDPIYRRDVIIAPDRMLRPHAMKCEPWSHDDAAACPFCRGREAMTPPTTLQLPSGSSDWQVRVIPNRYPAVSAASGNGQHEVIVESPDHVTGLLQLTEQQRQLVFRAYRSRFVACSQNSRFRAAVLFKNHGRAAGASQLHIHSQFVALNQPTNAMSTVCTSGKAYFDSEGRCIFCALVAAELAAGDRLVAETDRFVAFCPAASRSAYEIWILPKEHASRWECLDDERLRQFCQFASLTLARLENTVKHVAYNYAIHSAPFDSSFDQHYHWHMVINPRIAGIAGFELSTNVFINMMDPRIAAEQLRGASTGSCES